MDKTLEDNGIDPNQLKQEMQSAMGGTMPLDGMGWHDDFRCRQYDIDRTRRLVWRQLIDLQHVRQ